MNKTERKINFYKRSNEIHSNSFIYFDDFKTVDDQIKIKCKKCGYVNFVIAGSHLKKVGCAKCYGNNKLDNYSFLEKTEKLNKNYLYCLDTKISHKTYIQIYCKDCKVVFIQKVNNLLNNYSGCDCIKISKGVTKIINYLNKKKINYIREYRFNDCRNILPLPFDFYLYDKNICIEFDGEQHFMIKDCFGGIEEFENIKKRDDIKNKYCEANNIKLIRITYLDNIIEILNKILF